MTSRQRIGVGGAGGAGGGGGPAPTGNLIWGPDFGNPPESQLVVSASLPAVAITGTNTVGVQITQTRLAMSANQTVGATITLPALAAVYSKNTVATQLTMPALVINGNATSLITPTGNFLINALSSTSAVQAALTNYNIATYLDWADANVTTTNITNPANAIDKNTTTYAHAQAASTSSPLWLTNNTTNFTLVSSLPDFTTPFTTFTIDSVLWEYGYESIHTTGGVVVTAATCSTTEEYSIDDGAGWTTQETVTSIASGVQTKSVDLTSVIAGSWTNVSQFRARVNGSITSGIETGAQSIQQFRVHYNRLNIAMHKDNP